MPFDEDDIELQKHFTIYDTYPNFTPYLYSAWEVNRVHKYVTSPSLLHADNLYCFIRTSSGKGKLVTTLGTFDICENTLLLVRENNIVEYYAVDGVWSYNWFNFRTATPVPFFELNKIYSIVPTYTENLLKNEMFTVMQHYNEYNIQLTSSLFLSLVYSWIKVCHDQIENTSVHVADIKHILAYINNNLGAEIAVNDLAARCFLSERQFRLIFTSYMGISPKKYIGLQKLKKAAMLLRTTSQTITQIASDLNYSSPFHLSRDFKNQFGISPREYRFRSEE